MAAAGPSPRASSAAAAAGLSRRGRRGRCDDMAAAAAATSGASGPAPGSALLLLPPPPPAPRPEEPGCAGCLAALALALPLPCGHSLCRGCAQRAAGCPRCRARGRRARHDGPADAELPRGERARRRPPERCCRPSRDGGAAAAHKGPPEPEPEPQPQPQPQPRVAPAEPEFIFRAPIKLSKPGELCEEYESLRKLREEKLQEEKISDDQIHKLLPEDTETGKRKMEIQKKRDEPLLLKTNLERCPARLSDSENEEPSRGKMTQTHRSAFVSKNNSYSLAFLAGNLNSKVERSQSCNDTAQDRAKSRLRSTPASKAKGSTLTSASNPIIGVLLSTQNNRCLSAPDLAMEKRLPFSSLSSLASLHKPERSISPESNDSISEELNHFKPIVCSPCTPPKRLPDGGVLSPLIIKSTPRNLNRSLQKQTSYEASPRILKKWEQIFQERQIKKTLSKATLTSLAVDSGEDVLSSDLIHSSKEKPLLAFNARLPGRQGLPECIAPLAADLDHSPTVSQRKAPQGSHDNSSIETPSEIRKGGTCVGTLERGQMEGPWSTPDAKLDKICISTARKVLSVSSVPPKTSVLGGVLKTKKQQKTANHFDLPNGLLADPGSEDPLPALRRGRKRHCKTKHLEQNGSLKKLRQSAGEVGPSPPDPAVLEREQKLQQEEEDRRLALQLQRRFDSERRTVSRRKGSVDQYLLRSSSMAGAK